MTSVVVTIFKHDESGAETALRKLRALENEYLIDLEDILDRLPNLPSMAAYVKQLMRDKLVGRKHCIVRYGLALLEGRDWL